jgi:PAS domain S-box-containing protein
VNNYIEDRISEVDEEYGLLDAHAIQSAIAGVVKKARMPIIVTDPRQSDNPIVLCNEAFLELSGYEMIDVVGSNCRFLQGEETDKASIAFMKQAIIAERPVNVTLLNYSKDGKKFWNAVFITPVKDINGHTIFFFASQLDVTGALYNEAALSQACISGKNEVHTRMRELHSETHARFDNDIRVKTLIQNNMGDIASYLRVNIDLIENNSASAALKSVIREAEQAALS